MHMPHRANLGPGLEKDGSMILPGALTALHTFGGCRRCQCCAFKRGRGKAEVEFCVEAPLYPKDPRAETGPLLVV